MEGFGILVIFARPYTFMMWGVLLGLLLCVPCNGLSDEGQLLLQFKDNWDTQGKLSDWKSTSASDAHCNWTGVTCDNLTNSVVALKIPYLDIVGEIPPGFCQLSNLTDLDLSWNYFGGTFPTVLFNCTRLRHLNLSQNVFVGSLPEEIYKLEELLYMDLSANNFSGDVPAGLGRLPKIEVLLLHSNLLNGTVPALLGNLSTLTNLTLAYNPLAQGVIPHELGNLTRLQYLWMKQCNLEGEIPESLENITEMVHLDLSMNRLSGGIPPKLMDLSKLRHLYLFHNVLSGPIPVNISNLNRLVELDLSNNKLNESIPQGIENLTDLEILYLYDNELSGSIPSGLGNLAHLVHLGIWSNKLSGQVPPRIGMSSKLVEFDVSKNNLSGHLPLNLCGGGALVGFIAFSNKFNGTLPELGNCPSLKSVQVQLNQLSGEVPLGLWSSPLLQELRLANNFFYGQIPAQITKAANLSTVEISNNQFSGSIPPEIGNLPSLTYFAASGNNLSGSIPRELAETSSLARLFLDKNMLSGELPKTISWSHLNELNLANNNITGSIPPLLGSLQVLTSLDLSNNMLEGRIPSELVRLELDFFNLSGNHLSGPVPDGLNKMAYNQSFLDNPGLCGSGPLRLPSCKERSHLSKLLIAVIVVVAVVCSFALGWFYKAYKDSSHENIKTIPSKVTPFQRVEFQESDILRRCTEDNVFGNGGSGKVYKVTLPNRNTVAVKKIWHGGKMQSHQEKEFEAEIETLRKIRHPNIVKLLCCISSADSKLLVYEYMVNSNLYECLHGSPSENLDWPTRYNIAFGVAQGLAYMHHDCSPPKVHRDIKSKNILLDSEFKAHIADFGLARVVERLDQENPMPLFAGSDGYMAPESAYSLKVNEKCDIYSFGVVLLELVTGKKANESEFGDGLDIVRWIRKIYSTNGAQAVLDSHVAEGYKEEMMCMLRVALRCTNTLPINRPSTKEVVEMLLLCSPDEQARTKVAATLPPYLKRNHDAFMSAPKSSSISTLSIDM